MKIVPNPIPQKQKLDLDYLATRKLELSEQILQQQEHISNSTRQLLSPAAFSTYFMKSFTKGLSVIDGVMIGFKMVRNFRRIFKR